jgi:cellulose synthase/poly-beta-1,6-N-acetylglucosamine synthase-like glycosyltransferase
MLSTIWWTLGVVLASVWISRLLAAAFGIKQVADLNDAQWDGPAAVPPRVSIIVPARNEQKNIESALTSLLRLDYGNYEIIAVNDRSTDSTGEILDRLAATPAAAGKLKVMHIDQLPPGWLGKPHGMWRAAQQATGDWLLFTDADVIYRPDALRRAIVYAESVNCDHLTLVPNMVTESAGERMMVAFFQCGFFFWPRAWKVPDPRSRDFVGIGAFNFVRSSVYEKIGTFQALRMEIVEDMKLGKLVKKHGFSQRVALAGHLLRIRWVEGAMGSVRGLSKNFFAAMQFRWWLSLGSCLGLVLIYLVPFLGLAIAPGWSRIGFGLAVLSLLAAYVGMSTKSDIPPYYFLLHPVATLLAIYAILRSTAITLWQDGVTWRGTKYPLEELRKGLV